MKKNTFKVSGIFLVVILIGCMVAFGKPFQKNERAVAPALEISSHGYYQVFSRYGVDENPDFFELFATENALKRLKDLNKELHDTFAYLELQTQPLYVEGTYEGAEQFCNGYERGLASINEEGINFLGETVLTTALKTIFIGEGFHENFGDSIAEGKNFETDDFVIAESGQQINVILGAEYKEIYALGDTFTLTLHQKELQFHIIGFLKSNVGMELKGEKINLDYYIMLPFYHISYEPTDAGDELYQQIYYSQKNEGLIQADGNNKELKQEDCMREVESLAKKYDLLFSVPLSQQTVIVQKNL